MALFNKILFYNGFRFTEKLQRQHYFHNLYLLSFTVSILHDIFAVSGEQILIYYYWMHFIHISLVFHLIYILCHRIPSRIPYYFSYYHCGNFSKFSWFMITLHFWRVLWSISHLEFVWFLIIRWRLQVLGRRQHNNEDMSNGHRS
jgi:hypothetical protein